jgi:hypothetical protein
MLGDVANFEQKVSFTCCKSTILALWLAVFTVSCDEMHPAQVGGTETNGLRTVTISNVEPRRDVNGQIIDAHDGCLQFFDGRFYFYGTAYGTSDRFGFTNHYRVYSSPDLERWTYEGELLRDQPSGVYYRPYVVFNQSTRKYVLWYNWYPKLWDGQTGVAISDKPVGPFKIVNPNVHLSRLRPGDGSLFVDDDGTGYYIYTAFDEGYSVRVERLKPDYLDSTGESSGILATGTEAPVLFRRGHIYYALCGPRCLACREGSEVQVLISTSPLGPYTSKFQSNINRYPETGAPIQSTQELWAVAVSSSNNASANDPEKKVPMIIRTKNSPFISAQETWVAKILTSDGPVFIWMADRWSSSPDGVNGHDFQFWAPLEFGPDGDIRPIKAVKQWYISSKQ